MLILFLWPIHAMWLFYNASQGNTVVIADCSIPWFGLAKACIRFSDGKPFIFTCSSNLPFTLSREINDVLEMAHIFADAYNNTIHLPIFRIKPLHDSLRIAINAIKQSFTQHLEQKLQILSCKAAIHFLKIVVNTGVPLAVHPNSIFDQLFHKAVIDMHKHAKAKTIQRHFRIAISNPAFRLCHNRLLREFHDFHIS